MAVNGVEGPPIAVSSWDACADNGVVEEFCGAKGGVLPLEGWSPVSDMVNADQDSRGQIHLVGNKSNSPVF